MSAPALTLVPPAALVEPDPDERIQARGQMIVAVESLERALEALHSAAYFVERSARDGGGTAQKAEQIGRARDLLRETTRRIDAGLDHIFAHERRRG